MTTINLYAEDWLWDDYGDERMEDILDSFEFHVSWAYPDPYTVSADYSPAVLNLARDAMVWDKRREFQEWIENTDRRDSAETFYCCLNTETEGGGGMGGGSIAVGTIDPLRSANLPSANENWIAGEDGGIDLAIALQEIAHTFGADHDMGWSAYDDFDADGDDEQRTTPMTFRRYLSPNACGDTVSPQRVAGDKMRFSVGYSTCTASNASFPHDVTSFTYPTGD